MEFGQSIHMYILTSVALRKIYINFVKTNLLKIFTVFVAYLAWIIYGSYGFEKGILTQT